MDYCRNVHLKHMVRAVAGGNWLIDFCAAVFMVLRINFRLSNCEATHLLTSCNGWVALRHVWYDIIRWTAVLHRAFSGLYLAFYLVIRGQCCCRCFNSKPIQRWALLLRREVCVWDVYWTLCSRFWCVIKWGTSAVWILGVLLQVTCHICKVGFTLVDAHWALLRRKDWEFRLWMVISETKKAE